MLSDHTDWEDVPALMFERLALKWDEVTLRQAYPRDPAGRCLLRTFALPGIPNPNDVAAVATTEEGLVFPDYGTYCLIGPFGAAKILLLSPDKSDDDKIISITRFLAVASYHSASDTHLGYEGSRRFPMYPGSLLRKLFFSDQPLAIWCGQAADLLAVLLHQMGYACRGVFLKNGNHVGHIFTEAYFPTSGKWAIVDANFGVILRRHGVLLSTEEVIRLRLEGEVNSIEIVDLAGKAFPRAEVILPESFSGQVTWAPELMSDHYIGKSRYYYDVVITKGFEGAGYFEYAFGHEATTLVRSTLMHSSPLTYEQVSRNSNSN